MSIVLRVFQRSILLGAFAFTAEILQEISNGNDGTDEMSAMNSGEGR